MSASSRPYPNPPGESDSPGGFFAIEAAWAADPKRRLAVAMVPYWHFHRLAKPGC
jgi:hypothetical protein